MDILNYKKPGAAAALTFIFPGLGHIYARDIKGALTWMIVPFVLLIAFLILIFTAGYVPAVLAVYIAYIFIVPVAYRSAYQRVVDFNNDNNAVRENILEDPASAFMISIGHPGLGHLYIGALSEGIKIMRFSATLILVPFLMPIFGKNILIIPAALICFVIYFVSGFYFGKQAYDTAIEMNQSLTITEEKIKSHKTN